MSPGYASRRVRVPCVAIKPSLRACPLTSVRCQVPVTGRLANVPDRVLAKRAQRPVHGGPAWYILVRISYMLKYLGMSYAPLEVRLQTRALRSHTSPLSGTRSALRQRARRASWHARPAGKMDARLPQEDSSGGGSHRGDLAFGMSQVPLIGSS